MKKIIFQIIIISTVFSCQNESWDFPDNEFTTVYFPYQTPVRTLVLGDYTYDNENDNNLKFLISAHIGGLYENKENQIVDFIVDQSLTENLVTENNDTLELLPAKFYTLNPEDQIIIPQGQFYGGVEVQLNESFLNDSLAYMTHYILPVVITNSSLDSILKGKPNVLNPDRRIPGDWVDLPKDFTLFGIKYINKYHGKYLHRGTSIIKDNNENPYDTIIYRHRYIEQDEIWHLQTTGRDKVTVVGTIRASSGSPGSLMMDIIFKENSDEAIVLNNPASSFSISGTAKFVENGDVWGDQERNTMYLNYIIKVDSEMHFVKDTLVLRDRDVRFETFNPTVINK